VLKLTNNFKLEPSLVKILCNNITNRQLKFFDGSKYYPTYAGIGQGSALGPLLFSLYVNEISSATNVPFILYADDLILYTDGTDCNSIISQLESWFSNVCLWCENTLAYSLILTSTSTNTSILSYLMCHPESNTLRVLKGILVQKQCVV
jgi:hypothetical protein